MHGEKHGVLLYSKASGNKGGKEKERKTLRVFSGGQKGPETRVVEEEEAEVSEGIQARNWKRTGVEGCKGG